jgi:predicted nucleic acid-binding protein
LVEAKSRGLIAEVKPLMNALINQAGFWIAAPLYNSVLQFVNEDDSL